MSNDFSKENSATKNFIQLENVSKWFDTPAGRFEALKEVDLEISRGERLTITGKSGSGKSTLLNMLTGIDHPDKGRIAVDSVQLNMLDESRLARWRGANIGIVFQFFQLIPTLSVLENLLIAMDFVRKIPEPEKEKRALSLLEQVGILKHRDKYPSELSGGEQQRAAIARALANDPPIIIADEPTGNLDQKTSEDIRGLFDDLSRDGKTVIIVTHENVSGARYDRVITLADGKIERDNKNNEALESSQIQSVRRA